MPDRLRRYWPPNERNDVTASLLKRAAENGYTVLVVTLDVGLQPLKQ